MVGSAEQTICRFYRLIPDAPDPQRADRSADGNLTVNAYRYCEPMAAASAFGWYLYPPMSFSLWFDGTEIAWTYPGADGWSALRGAQFPDFANLFDRIAPAEYAGLAPPFLVRGSLPGGVQIWSGYLARTAPGWALLTRGAANIPRTQSYENFEGIIETDTWFGPLFTNIRLTRTNSPIEFHVRRPLFQVQPLPRQAYAQPPFEVLPASDLTADDWQRFGATIEPNLDQMRALGHYAVDTRKRLRRE